MAAPQDAVRGNAERALGLASVPAQRSRPRGALGGTKGGRPNDGRVNGLVNGRGRINGTGYVNGLPIRRNPFGLVTTRDLRRSAVFLAASLAIILVLGAFLGTPVPESSPFGVDGDFSEWRSVVLYSDAEDTQPGHADLVEYAVYPMEDRIYVYGRTREPLFAGPDASSVFVIVDQGDPAMPVYATPVLAANFLAELYGWDGRLVDAVLRAGTGADPDNATALQTRGSIPAAAVGYEFELELSEVHIDLRPSREVRLLVATNAGNATDVGAVVGRTPGVLLVEQRPLAKTLSGPTPLLEVRLRALAADVTVASMTLQQTGGGVATMPAFPFTIPAGMERVETIAVDPGTLPGGTFLTVRVGPILATTASGASVQPTLSGDGARAYVGSLPVAKTVDGIFDDWSGPTPDADDALSPSVDILGSATTLPGDAFFYLRTEGQVLAGSFLPERRQRPSSAQGPASNATVVPMPRHAGEDVLRIFVDTDDQDPMGQPVAWILADRMLEVRGRLGRITASQSYVWNAASWRWVPQATTFAVDFVGSELEASVPPSFLGAVSNASVVFATSDWSRQGDLTDPLGLRGTRGGSQNILPMHGFLPDETPAPPLRFAPILDGLCPSFPGEYMGAAIGGTPDFTFLVGTRAGPRLLWLCIIVTSDTTDDFFDFSEIMFDTKHDGGATPQPDDRLFYISTNNSFGDWLMGDGLGWVSCTGVCDPADAAVGSFNNGTQRYEYRIRWTDVWGDLNPPYDAVAGFAIIIYDDSFGFYWWGSPFLSDTAPDTWGHIILPEFPAPVLAVTASLAIPFVRRWRASSRRRAANT